MENVQMQDLVGVFSRLSFAYSRSIQNKCDWFNLNSQAKNTDSVAKEHSQVKMLIFEHTMDRGIILALSQGLHCSTNNLNTIIA